MTIPSGAIQVRRATEADTETICEFNRLLAWETEHKTLERELLRAGVLAVLADDGKGLYFVAEEDSVILGQIAVTYEWSDWRNGNFWWLQSVYVRSDARRRGIFRRIFDHIRAAAKADAQVIGMRLYVENDNERAHATYLGLGLEWTSYKVMERYPL